MTIVSIHSVHETVGWATGRTSGL